MIPRLIYVNIHNVLKTIEKDNQSNISTQKRLNQLHKNLDFLNM